jgi:hypothetical protein
MNLNFIAMARKHEKRKRKKMKKNRYSVNTCVARTKAWP